MGQPCGLQDGRTLGSRNFNAVDFKINSLHVRFSLPLSLIDGAELTFLHAGAALDTLVLVDDMGILHGADDGAGRAGSRAERTAAALIPVNVVGEQSLADSGGTALLLDVGLILVTEIPQSGENRIGSRLAQSAQGVGLYIMAQLLQLV